MRTERENSGSTPGHNCDRSDGDQCPSCPWLFWPGGERTRLRLFLLRRLEHRVRLARIGIEPEDEKLRGQRAEIDDAADQRLRIVPLRLGLLRFGIGAGRCVGLRGRKTRSTVS